MANRELITWRGTPGVGDFMWALNCAYNYCWKNNKKVVLEMHWSHDEDHLHHFEEEETIIDRFNYIHNFYHQKENKWVVVKHIFNAQGRYRFWKYEDDVVYDLANGMPRQAVIARTDKARFWFESGAYSDANGAHVPCNDWVFRQGVKQYHNPKKIVIWRPTFNAEQARTWKRGLTNEEWDDIISKLRAEGFSICELTYRTPVSEAFYEISSCRMVLCYDGMWHYIARNMHVPMIVISKDGVTKYHTPHAMAISGLKQDNWNIHWYVHNMKEFLGQPKVKAVAYEERDKELWQAKLK